MNKTILAIESSCDETGIAITRNGQLLCNIVSTQIDVHQKYGGVMPEIASRLHTENILIVLKEALEKLDEVMPGINNGSTLLYAPEVKFRSSMISTKNNLETNIDGLYVAGDGAGVSGSVTGAAVTGIMFARGLN